MSHLMRRHRAVSMAICTAVLGLGVTLGWALLAQEGATLDVQSNGLDGAFAPVADIEIDLRAAVTGSWNDEGRIEGNGVYDPEQWAVVFHYTSVNIPENVTVTFKNRATRPPVVWLVDGDVTIDGVVDISGLYAACF